MAYEHTSGERVSCGEVGSEGLDIPAFLESDDLAITE